MLNKIFTAFFNRKKDNTKYTTCSYCGVGCQFYVDKDLKIKTDDKLYNGKNMCIKGLSLLETLNKGRLLSTYYRKYKSEKFKNINYNEAIKIICEKIKQTKAEKIAFYSAGQVLTEDYYIGNKLFKGFIGTPNVDSNSRTCISSALVALKTVIGDDYIPTRMEDVLETDLIIIAGANPANAHVVFFDKFIKKAKKNGKKIVVIDPINTETAKISDLFLQINTGTDLILNNCIISYLLQNKKLKEPTENIKNRVNNWNDFYKFYKNYNYKSEIEKTGIKIKVFENFINNYLLKYDKIISITAMGYNQSYEGVYKNISLLNIHILLNKLFGKGNGYLPETGQSNAMGGREVSGLSNLLAVHLDYNEENRKKVAKFWKTDLNILPKKPGKTILEIMEAANRGEIEILIIMHTDPIYSLPNRGKMEKIIKKIPLVVEINAYENTETSNFVNIRIPAKPWGEKQGRQTNLDRKISEQNIIFENQYLNIKKDWKILVDIAKELGFKKQFNYKNSNQIFKEFKNMTKLMKTFDNYSNIKIGGINNYQNKNFVWENKDFKNKQKVFTINGNPNLIITKENYKELVNEEYPLTLISYRIKEHWNSGSKTFLSDKIIKKIGRNGWTSISEKTLLNIFGFVIKEGTNIKIISKVGKIVLPLKINNNIKENCIAIPTFERKINYLTDDSLFDPFSRQPAYNSTPVKIKI